MFDKNDLIECCSNLKLASNIGYKTGNLNSFIRKDIEKVVFLTQKKDDDNSVITNTKCLFKLDDNRYVYYSIKYNSETNKLYGFGLVDDDLSRMVQLGLDRIVREEFYSKTENGNIKYEGVELDFNRKTIEGLESIKYE